MQAMGLVALGLGIDALVQHLPHSKYPVQFIVSLVVGGVIRQRLGLESRFNALVNKYLAGNLAEGLATAISLLCIGILSILNPIEAALEKDYMYLLANCILDGITSIVLASILGIGIAISGIILFVWQGSIYAMANLIGNSLNPNLLNKIIIIRKNADYGIWFNDSRNQEVQHLKFSAIFVHLIIVCICRIIL